MNENNEAYSCGYDDGYNGKDFSCPYPENSQESEYYADGFDAGGEDFALEDGSSLCSVPYSDGYNDGYMERWEGNYNNPYTEDSYAYKEYDRGYYDGAQDFEDEI